MRLALCRAVVAAMFGFGLAAAALALLLAAGLIGAGLARWGVLATGAALVGAGGLRLARLAADARAHPAAAKSRNARASRTSMRP